MVRGDRGKKKGRNRRNGREKKKGLTKQEKKIKEKRKEVIFLLQVKHLKPWEAAWWM